jgi:type IV secretion system protein VirB8
MAAKEKAKKTVAPERQKQQKFKVKSWYANRYQFVLIQRNILLIFALFSTVAVSFGMIFLNRVVSSKSLEPYVIEIEDKTGNPTVVKQVTVEEFTANEAMKKYFVNQFVNVSTGYSPKTYPGDVEKVRVLSNSGVFSDFRSRIRPRALGTNTTISVRIKSIQFPNANTAQVRILKVKAAGLASSKDITETNELVTLNFYFDPKLVLSAKERLLNPLGFQVKNYSLVEEIINY